jgi:branched-subunit amino acid aminotransferase/4-amino-4-deoxychorismate lyase
MSLAVSSRVRSASDSLTRHKTVSYLANLVIRDQARKAGCDDALIVDSEGNVAETSTANVFVGLGSRIVTPSLGCILPGIVRQWVLRAAPAADVTVEECRLPAVALSHCEYAFVTNSVVGLVGVSKIAGRPLAPASSTPAFDRLQMLYRDQLRLAAS